MKETSTAPAGGNLQPGLLPAGLYPVAVPIGNPLDITLRALQTLVSCQAIICEERRAALRLFRSYGIEKPLYQLNEHTRPAAIRQMFQDLLITKERAIALISDAGTPCFADPGAELVRLCLDFQVPVHPVPGASSLMAALVASGIVVERFLYYGFLSTKKEERRSELAMLKNMSNLDIVFLEAPYRLKALLADMTVVIGVTRSARLLFQLTQAGQTILCGTLGELSRKAEKLPKGEFVLILERISSKRQKHAQRPKKHI